MTYYALIDNNNEVYDIDINPMSYLDYICREATDEEVAEFRQKQEEERFNQEFFKTSLGYVRRNVTMQNGSIKDFLCDILPLLKVNIPILTYDRQLNQSKVFVTEQFINECQDQVLIDFYGVSQ